jgi:DNA-binding MarR family transcriptional regulator
MKDQISQVMETFSDIMKLIHQQTYSIMRDKNIYPGQPRLITLIKRNEGITQKELSQKNCVKPATITEMLKKLELNHYVYRVPDEKDKRIMRVYLTAQGQRFAEHSEQYAKNMTDLIFRGFSDEELHTFTRLMGRIRNNLVNEKNELH